MPKSGLLVTGDGLNVNLLLQTVSETSLVQDEHIAKTQTDSKPAEKICVTPIHLRPDLLIPCADLVNAEWQRSQSARVHSLQKSCPDFPIHLVLLLQVPGQVERLLGHARLSRVVGHSGSLFVESVVVSKEERGKGYGRTLMEDTERYAKSRGFKRLCLTTHDKQHFYTHLGYKLSTPVQSAGAMASFIPMEMLLRFSSVPNGGPTLQKQRDTEVEKGMIPCPPPPPPLTSAIPPPPPPLSFNPPPLGISPVVQSLTETPYRDAKGVSIFWMHKDL